MEIQWFGHYCFRLSQRGRATVVTDPFDPQVVGYKPVRTRTDVVTISRPGPEQGYIKGLRGVRRVLDAPGEYEIGGVFIIGVALGAKAQGQVPGKLFVFDYDGLVVAHLGGLTRVPTQKELEALGPVHIALVPVGGRNNGLTPTQAVDVLALLEPAIIIPMAYHTSHTSLELLPLERFLKALGTKAPRRESVLKVSSPNGLPQEPQLVLLEPQV